MLRRLARIFTAAAAINREVVVCESMGICDAASRESALKARIDLQLGSVYSLRI